jgi:hypothetical protein
LLARISLPGFELLPSERCRRRYSTNCIIAPRSSH